MHAGFFCREAAGFGGASGVRCSCVCVCVCVCVFVYGGRRSSMLKFAGAERSFCHHRWTGKARGGHLKSRRQCRLHAVCVCVCVCVFGILTFVCVCHNRVADRSTTKPPSHATNAIPVDLGCPPNHQISHTYIHIHTLSPDTWLSHAHTHTHK